MFPSSKRCAEPRVRDWDSYWDQALYTIYTKSRKLFSDFHFSSHKYVQYFAVKISKGKE